MFEQFKDHIGKFVKIDEQEFAQIITYFRIRFVDRKENLLEQGQVCNVNYFVLEGLLRKFFINEKGVQQTTEFALENWWMTENFSYLHRTPTEFYVQAVENTRVLSIDRTAYEELLLDHPCMERYFRCVYQKAYAAAQMRVKFIYGHSREELYHQFRQNYPAFIQRVPQFLLASFLGVTPEYLSEIRKKSVS